MYSISVTTHFYDPFRWILADFFHDISLYQYLPIASICFSLPDNGWFITMYKLSLLSCSLFASPPYGCVTASDVTNTYITSLFRVDNLQLLIRVSDMCDEQIDVTLLYLTLWYRFTPSKPSWFSSNVMQQVIPVNMPRYTHVYTARASACMCVHASMHTCTLPPPNTHI